METRAEQYLQRLRWALSKLPEEDRREIVEETRSHLIDCQSASRSHGSVEQAIAELGEPEEYARAFLENYEITAALASGSVWQMMRRVGARLGTGITVSCAFFAFLILYGAALTVIVAVILKPVFPEHIGFWTSSVSPLFAIGYVDDPHRAGTTEHLGYWIIPLGIISTTLIYLGATRLLRLQLRWLRDHA